MLISIFIGLVAIIIGMVGFVISYMEMGSTLPSPFMTMALIPLACLPETRLTNRGLVDCRTFEFINLVEN